ncbi:MAG: Trk family potassium uptake protein [Ruminococcaceae bacterium]|nr:Trk family potassium uptake protein [Oscillospiraceae bacterium]
MQKGLKKIRKKMSNTRLIAVSFAVVILIGTLLLCCPFSSREGVWTNPVDALFTATTSTCVTGLVVRDTGMYWSFFGQVVILVLIQVGGIGFMTILTLFSFFLRHQISLHDRRLLQQSAGSLDMSGVSATFRQIILGTFLLEGLGACLLSLRFYPQYGKIGIWYSVFHSVSAFCNAGLDLLSPHGSSSLIAYRDDLLVSGTLMFLIVMGGLGFLVWNDLLHSGFRPSRMQLHTKLVLSVSGVLLLVGWVGIYLTERDASMAALSEPQKIWASLFQSVTTRTAGLMTIDQATLSDSGALLSMMLMLVGGSPGSTAGGAKTTTVAVFLLCSWQLARNREHVTVFKRRIDNRIVRQAGAVVCFYLLAVLLATLLICAVEPFGLREVLYETVSAIATVGLSMNLTPMLGVFSKLILILLMYAGRLGGLSIFLAMTESQAPAPLERPVEKILIG